MKPASSNVAIPPSLMADLEAAAALPDNQVDLTDRDAAEVTDWSGAVRGRFYKPVKTLKSLRLDADVLAYFQAQGKGYQTRINALLREAMMRDLRQAVAEQDMPKKAG